jgi:CRP-like cAMP-binding protein
MDNPSDVIKRSNFWANLFKTPTEKEDLETVLKSMPPFQKLSTKYIQLLSNIIHNRVYTENEYIFYEGDPGVALYIILDGEIKIFQNNGEDKINNLVTLVRGDFFGELALIDGDVRSASAVAVKDSTIAVIFKPDLYQFIEQHPKRGIKILAGISEIIATRLRIVNKDYIDLVNKMNI